MTRKRSTILAGVAVLAAAGLGAGIAAATAAGLYAAILMFGPVSGAHFNPVVSFADAALGGLSRRDAAAYLPALVAGCVTGAVAANLMFAGSAVSTR